MSTPRFNDALRRGKKAGLEGWWVVLKRLLFWDDSIKKSLFFDVMGKMGGVGQDQSGFLHLQSAHSWLPGSFLSFTALLILEQKGRQRIINPLQLVTDVRNSVIPNRDRKERKKTRRNQ
jgi:hypothetical protein